jgi:hypothetical protein
MAVVDLPNSPAPNSAQFSIVGSGGVQRGATGGASQIINRLGDHYKLAVTFPPLPNNDTGRKFVAGVVRARRLGLRMEFPLAGIDQGSPGAPVVDGAGQSGTSLNVRGLVAGYVCGQGFWLSIVKDGQHYLHNAYVQRVAGANGKATLGIEPPLRVPFPDGAAINLAQPMIEGYIDLGSWDVSLAHHVGLGFTIEESA